MSRTGGAVKFRRLNCFAAEQELSSWRAWHYDGIPLSDYFPENSGDFLCRHNGEFADPKNVLPEPGDVVELVEIPRGAEAALIIIPIIAAAVLTAGSYLAQRYLVAGPEEPDFSGPEGPTNSFGGVQTISAAGVPLPLLYGEVKVGGNVVDSFESSANDRDLVVPTDEFTFKKGVTNQILTAMSRSNLRMVICEGPIESIDRFEIDARDPSEFPGLIVTHRLGTQHQPAIAEFDKSAVTRTLATPVDQLTPFTFTTSVPIEQLEIVLRFPEGIYKIKEDGIRFNRLVELSVEWKLEGADESETEQFTIDGFSVNPLEYRIRLPQLERAIYEVTVTRISPDEVTQPEQNNFSRFEVFFVNEIEIQDHNYPGVAQMAFSQLPGEQVSPVQPSNYTAIAKGFNDIRQYTSLTEFTTGYTNNPAWCCAHFITRQRGALGRFFTFDDIDIPSFMDWAAWCDELVEDGNSALEPRATYNRLLDTRDNAADIIQTFAVGTNTTLLYSQSKFRAIVDRPRPRSNVFSEATVLEGQLNKVYLPASQLPTRINVRFNNKELGYERDSIMQEDDSRPVSVQGERAYTYIWITSPGQAARQAKLISTANVLLRRAVQFKAGIQGLGASVGDVIGVASYGLRIGLGSGNIRRIEDSNQVLWLDQEITFDGSKEYAVSVQHQFDGEITTIPVVNPGDGIKTDRIRVISGVVWKRRLQVKDVYAFGELDEQIEDYRIDEVSYGDLSVDNFSVDIRAGKYDQRLYSVVPTSNEFVELNTRPTQLETPGRVNNLTVRFSQAEPESYVGRRAQRTLEIDWNPPDDGFLVDYYEVFMREANNVNPVATWRFVGAVNGVRFEVSDNIDIDTRYQVTVRGVSPNGLRLSLDQTPKADIDTY